jgi:SPX domain
MITLTPVQLRFFEMLNEELRKVDKFYVEREYDALAHSSLLKKQLRELQRRLVDVRSLLLHIFLYALFISPCRIPSL